MEIKEDKGRYMKIEEAILYCLASQNRGMRTEQIADMINHGDLYDQRNYYLRPKYWDSILL